MKEIAVKYYKEGYSCSEALLKAAQDKMLISPHIIPIASAFSGGISSGCLCGAVAAAIIIIGALHGRCDISQSNVEAKSLAKEFMEKFKLKRGMTCCKGLTAKFDFNSPARKENCVSIIEDAVDILIQVAALDNLEVTK